MYFTNGGHRAFESLMQDRPGADHYDSGAAGQFLECRDCRYHWPGGNNHDCAFDQCPYFPDHVTVTEKNNPNKGGGADT